MRKSLLLLGALLVGTALTYSGRTLHAQELETRVVVSGRDIPWEIIWGPDGWIWMTEIRGKVSRVNPETGQVVELISISDVRQSGEGGLLGMALHPDFATTPQVFVAYNYMDNGATMERIVRYEYNGTNLVNPVILLSGIKGSGIHNGCRLLFAPDKTLLITTGDAADQTLPQNHTSLNGKVLRINPDGTIPADNPWPGSPLFTTGHRNAQGLTFGPQGKLYSSEHGPSTDDEVNIIVQGENYGWPNVHGYCNTGQEQTFCEDSSVVEPIAAWTPTIAVCGLVYYNHNSIPEWNNSLLMATLKASKLVQLKLSNDGSTVVEEKDFFSGQFGRLRDLCIAPDGRVFVSTSNNSNNQIIEIKSTSTQPAQMSFSTETLDFGTLLMAQTDTTVFITLTNTGGASLNVNEYTISGPNPSSFSITGFSPFTLEPNQQQILALRFNPDGNGEKKATFLARAVTPNNVTVTATVALRGVKSMQSVSIAAVDFGSLPVGQTAQREAIISNTGQGALILNALSLSTPTGNPFRILSPTLLPVTIAAGSSQSVIIEFDPQAPGVYQSTLTAMFDDGIVATGTLAATATLSTDVHETGQLPLSLQVIPTPATNSVEIRMATPHRGMALWSIVDMTGQTVFQKEIEMRGGQMSVHWNGHSANGAMCPTGLYTAVVVINGQQLTVPVVLVR